MHRFQVLNLSEQDAVGPILINLLVRLRNLQVTIRNKLFGFAVLMQDNMHAIISQIHQHSYRIIHALPPILYESVDESVRWCGITIHISLEEP